MGTTVKLSPAKVEKEKSIAEITDKLHEAEKAVVAGNDAAIAGVRFWREQLRRASKR